MPDFPSKSPLDLFKYLTSTNYNAPNVVDYVWSKNISTYRGRRSGKTVHERELQQNQCISTRVTPRDYNFISEFASQHFNSTRFINHHNLVKIQPERSPNQQRSNTLFYSQLGLWNARSVNNKSTAICDYVLTEKLDILVLTETWLKGDVRDNTVIADITNNLPDHQLIHVPRSSTGGGVCVILRKGYTVKQNLEHKCSSFEHLDLVIASGSTIIRLLSVYRPPPSKKNGLNAVMFLEEFSSFLESLVVSQNNLLIAGDFNFHVDNLNDRDASQFLDLIESVGLTQHVNESTHKRGHTLDLIITRSSENLISHIKTSFDLPSDHAIITSRLTVPRPKPIKIFVKHRKLRSINIKSLQDDISASSLLVSPNSDISALVDQYNMDLQRLCDVHAPEKSRFVTIRPHAPWYNQSLQAAKQERRKRERKFRSTKLEIHKQLYKDQCSIYQNKLEDAKTSYHREKLKNCNQKELFGAVDKMVNGKKSTILPSLPRSQQLAELFSGYFSDKISRLRVSLDNMQTSQLSVNLSKPLCCNMFSTFSNVSTEHLRKLIMRSPTKSCILDPIPTCILKECLSVMIKPLTQLVNMSLSTGYVPSPLKSARVFPCIKKPTLNPEELKNYRPISNLPFVSKTIERVVAEQLQEHLMNNDLFNKTQSAYRKNHSTETALVRVHNDILLALDRGDEVLLVLLDFSAAFDTIDHSILLDRLKHRFGISGTILKWLHSYLSSRTQTICVNNTVSSSSVLTTGVPQGSVLGPLLFTLYISPLEDLIKLHEIDSMLYADDSQLYLLMKPSEKADKLHQLGKCVQDIKTWTRQNKLLLNDSKTEALHIYSKFLRHTPTLPTLSLGDVVISPVSEVRDLGAVLDKHFSFKKHINNMCKSATLAIRNIGKLRKYLDENTTNSLVHAFVTSRLDSYNSLLYGLPSTEVMKLQRIQNIAARLVTRTKRTDHISPVLRKLHWLPVQERITFKLLLLCYKALHGLAPSYLSELLTHYNPGRSLRSSSKYLLSIPKSRTSSFGDRAFSSAAPKLWNTLPLHIKTAESVDVFKSKLKTYLFS